METDASCGFDSEGMTAMGAGDEFHRFVTAVFGEHATNRDTIRARVLSTLATKHHAVCLVSIRAEKLSPEGKAYREWIEQSICDLATSDGYRPFIDGVCFTAEAYDSLVQLKLIRRDENSMTIEWDIPMNPLELACLLVHEPWMSDLAYQQQINSGRNS